MKQESLDPNRGSASALKRGPPQAGEPGASPSKQQRKKNKLDRRTRRVSFAPDPELTMVHHFEKDDFTANSSEGRPVLSRLEEQEDADAAGYQPGFRGMTVPDHSPLGGSLPLDSSPGMVSMDITQPVLAEVYGGANEAELPLGQQDQHGWTAAAFGEVTAALPSMGALAEEDEYEEELQQQQQQQQQAPTGAAAAAGWADGDVTLNVTLNNITSGIPGLSSLIAEDEEADAVAGEMAGGPEEVTAGMDLTVAAGRVLEHAAQEQQQPEMDAQPLAEPAEAEPAPQGRRSSTGELAQQRVVQANKWGFAPGCEDTMDINLEMHGRMIMGDTTFNRMYGDNTTGDTTLGRSAGVEEDGDFSLPAPALQPAVGQPDAGNDLLLSPEPSPAPAAPAAREQAEPPRPVAQPNWQAPAFMPPYLQKAHTATSDHPALVHSPADTNSTMNTIETRRLSVGIGDTRRLSVGTTRRMSMQDATGRLLADDFEDDLGLDLRPAAQPFSHGRPSDAGTVGGRDMTEKLLADDQEEDDLDLDPDDHGPFADMKRQLRLLNSQEPAVLLEEEQPAVEEEAPAAKTARTPPRPAHSMGVADSSGGPATMALLRSGGTTRLLRDTMHVKPPRQGAQGEGAAQPARSSGGNGTTKLLADMTMASVVGAKLQRQSAGLLAQRRMSQDAENVLTDYSLDGFDTPPELPDAQQLQQPEAQPQQGEPVVVPEEGEMDLEDEPQFQQQQQQARTPPPTTSQGYPLPEDFHELPLIPGGPKLARTPMSVRPGASQRTQGTPHSMRSMPHQATPLSRQHASTPGSAARAPNSVATYPLVLSHEDTLDRIPGGPKLHRTPVGGRPSHLQPVHEQPGAAKTPLTGRLGLLSGAPGSAMAQHYPGTGQRLGSALLARYPGSAVAAHRLGARGMTPQQSQPLPMTFQDFTKLMDVQFLDNLRRGASINYADMQRNPVPKNTQEAYTLLCAISPQVAVLENGIRILQELVQERRTKSAESETFIGLHNPSLFGEVQYVDEERLEEMKASVGLLKKLLRQKAVAELKAYRKEMEEDKAHRLMHNLELLQQDRVFLETNEQNMGVVARAAQQYIAEQQRRMEEEALGHQAEAERRQRVLAMRASLAEQQEANAQRQQQLAEVQGRVASLKTQNSMLGKEREAVQARIQALEQRLSETQGAAALANQSSPQALLDKSEQLEVLTACAGWRLERLQQGGDSAQLALRLGDLFRLQLRVGGGAATGSVQLVAGAATAHLPEDRRQLAAGLAAASGLGEVNVQLTGAGTANLMAVLQAVSARLGCIAELLREVEGLRLGCPCLSEVACAEGAVHLSFINLETEVKFSVALGIPSSYPAGGMPHELRIRWDGSGHITADAVAAALAAVPEGRGRIRAACAALSKLASSAQPAQPYFLRPASPASPETAPGMLLDAAFNNYQNPLFGAPNTASCSMQS